MTAGELITALQTVDPTTEILIRIVVPGGTTSILVNGFTAQDTTMTKPVESFTVDAVA